MNRPQVRSSLALRLGLLLALPVVVGMLLFGVQVRHARRAEMLREAEHEASDLGSALEVALDAFLRDRSLADLAEMTEDLSRAERVLGVVVFDAEARPVQWSRAVSGDVPRVRTIARRALARNGTVGAVLIDGRRSLYAHATIIHGDASHGARGAVVTLRDLAYVDAQLWETSRDMFVVGLSLAVGLVLLAWLALRVLVLRPLSRLSVSVARVGGGALDGEVAVERDDEVGALAGAFNEMVRSLRDARAELHAQSNAKVALERRLQHTQRLAIIGQLSASLAHRIGSPLNVVLGRAKYALQQPRESTRDERQFREILAGAKQISTVIEGLLSRAREVRGTVEYFDLAALVDRCLGFVEVECERAGIRVTRDGDDVLLMRGIRDEIEQVVLNLVLNAIQAQPEGGTLRVSVTTITRDGAQAAQLRVEDRGPGVDPGLRESIFEPFFTTKQSGRGTGLGLSICDEIVRGHGGVILCEENPPRGARFVVELPVSV